MWKFAIFGAKSIALGTCLAVQKLYKDFEVIGFLVTSRVDNPSILAGLPVYELDSFLDKQICILVATPEDTHIAIVQMLEQKGFHNHICIDSGKESNLMSRYFATTGKFRLLQTNAKKDSSSF